jgi:hypothetical protein
LAVRGEIQLTQQAQQVIQQPSPWQPVQPLPLSAVLVPQLVSAQQAESEVRQQMQDSLEALAELPQLQPPAI